MYPPVPYPPLAQTSVEAAAQTPSTARVRKFATPFRPPRQVIPTPPPSVPTPKRARPTPLTSPSSRSSPPPQPTPLRRPAPFKPLSVSPSTSHTPSSALPLSVQITALERKVQTLRQARKYQEADETGGNDGEIELRALCDRWKEFGAAAATALFEYAGDPTTSDANPAAAGAKGWDSTWGFAASSGTSSFFDPPASRNDNNPFGNSSGWGPSTTPQLTTEQFLERVDAEGKRTGRDRTEVLEDMEKDAGELPTVDELLKMGMRLKNPGGVKRKWSKSLEHDEEEDDERRDEREDSAEALATFEPEDNYLDGLDDLDEEVPSDKEEEEVLVGDEDAVGAEVAKKWTIGRLLRNVGVDPQLFGWCDDEEDFVT